MHIVSVLQFTKLKTSLRPLLEGSTFRILHCSIRSALKKIALQRRKKKWRTFSLNYVYLLFFEEICCRFLTFLIQPLIFLEIHTWKIWTVRWEKTGFCFSKSIYSSWFWLNVEWYFCFLVNAVYGKNRRRKKNLHIP